MGVRAPPLVRLPTPRGCYSESSPIPQLDLVPEATSSTAPEIVPFRDLHSPSGMHSEKIRWPWRRRLTSGQREGDRGGENLKIFLNVPATSRNSFRLFYGAVGTSSGKRTMLAPSTTTVKSLLPESHAHGL